MASRWKISLWLPLLIFALALAARAIPGPRTIDDSFITFRYVRNILAGNGFVYNPGEQVLGTTTPLYTGLLVVVGSLTGGVEAPFPTIALWINALADGLTAVLLWRLGRRLGAPWAGAGAALVWAIAPYSVTFAIGGLETSIYVLLMVALVGAHIAGRHILTALLAALMLLTRPDALILLGPVGLDRLVQIFRQRKTDLNLRALAFEVLAFGLPMGLWFAFSFAYFGSPLPHSIAAKSVAYLLPPAAAGVRLLQHYNTIFLGHLTFGIPWIGVGMVLYPFLYLLGARYAFQRTTRIWPFLIYPWFYFLVFAIANPLIFRWYLTPPLPALMLFVLIGAQKIIYDIAGWLAKRRAQKAGADEAPETSRGVGLRLALIFFVVLAPVLLSMREWRLKTDHGLTTPAPDMAWYKLELLYRQAANYLVGEFQTPAEQVVLAAGDVGVLGFFTQARILDTVGLNSPESTEYYPLPESFHVNAYAVAPDLILDKMPDYLVILEVYGRGALLVDPRFQEAYTLIHLIPTDIYDSQGMLIFARNDLAP